MTYEILKNHPMPDGAGPGRATKYPFEKMEVGDAIKLPPEVGESATRAAYAFAKRHGITVTAMRSADGVTIWRTA